MADSTSLVVTLHGDDDVAIARGAIAAGTVLHELDGLVVTDDIPAAHKVALRALKAGDPVRRYGQIIGFATQAIEPGEHVHTHNLAMGRSSATTRLARTPELCGAAQQPRHVPGLRACGRPRGDAQLHRRS